jgi:hypothetical protein
VPILKRRTLTAVPCLLILAFAVPAYAAREPSLAERAAVTAALPQWVRNYPVGCVWLKITVANAGGSAKVTPVYLNASKAPCAKYASNGYWILKKGTHWRVIYNGSELPACTLHVPKDLSPCRR